MTAAPTEAARPYSGHRAAAGRGLALVLSGTLLLTCSDTIAKLVFDRAPLSQYVVLVGVIVLPGILLLMTLTRRLPSLRIRNRGALSLRALCMMGSTLFFFAGLQRMPLGDIYAVAFTSPIITLLLAAWLLREQVGWRRWSAVLIGFLGVVLVMLPSGQGYAWTAALFPLGAALCGALRDITSRRLAATEDSLGVLFYSVMGVLAGGLCLSFLEDWAPVDLGLVGMIAACALIQTTASLLQIEAYRFAEVSFLAPFRYVVLLFAALLGFLVWGDVPTWNVALGGLVIVGSGLFIWHRERLLRKRSA
jgi:drug/metabolite transporter (DMT)-like permease